MSPFASSDSGSPSVTGTSGPTSTVRKIGVEEVFAFVIEILGLEGRRGRRTEGSAFASGTRAGKLSRAPTRAPEEARQGAAIRGARHGNPPRARERRRVGAPRPAAPATETRPASVGQAGPDVGVAAGERDAVLRERH